MFSFLAALLTEQVPSPLHVVLSKHVQSLVVLRTVIRIRNFCGVIQISSDLAHGLL
jgi:hypothetical protein